MTPLSSARTPRVGGTFFNLDDLNGQFRHWLDVVANPRVHATPVGSSIKALAEQKLSLQAAFSPRSKASSN
jgi:hypothetical protein